jgi:diguanylate cyclase (GGDEF)-like protein
MRPLLMANIRQDSMASDDSPVEVASDDTSPVWRSLLVYGLIPLVGAPLIYTARIHGNKPLELGVYVGATALLVIIFLRQVLATLESRRLYARLDLAYQELGTKNTALVEANGRLQMLATTDPLTELPNQRVMVATLDLEFERGRRYGRRLSVLFIDLDHFKQVNDEYGHLAGDSVLQEVSAVIRGALRSVDTLGRWGGEEFVVVLPEVDSNGALIVAERIREAVAEHRFSSAPCRLTASIGVASYPDDAESRTKLIDAADRAMYAAKRLGRNHSRTADDPLDSTTESESQRSVLYPI